MQSPSIKILFAASEAYPLIKTGGLADVAGSLPRAIKNLKQDICLVIPAYPEVIEKAGDLKQAASIEIDHIQVVIMEGRLPGTMVRLWLIDCPQYFDRQGNPYTGDDGEPWPDNAERFNLFARAVVSIATDSCGFDWRPDVVHCNDWQTGLVPALLSMEDQRPATVFTIHNLAYQGLFPYDTFKALELPDEMWTHETLEFHEQLSFIKGGLVYADRINTVSPSYAREIQKTEFGCGLEGLLQHRSDTLSGILNGIDTDEWNPDKDPYLLHHYSRKNLEQKKENKKALQQQSGLAEDDSMPLIGSVGRLVEQKGIDIVLKIMPILVKLPLQFIFLGSGNPVFEQLLQKWAKAYPRKISVSIGYDEQLAHRIEAGADMFLMPSRFEPCGLNQMYSLHYGTIPIVNRVGGLADTVVHADEVTLESGAANGIVVDKLVGIGLLSAIQHAADLFNDKDTWEQLQRTAMQQEFSWKNSAQKYLALYQDAIQDHS